MQSTLLQPAKVEKGKKVEDVAIASSTKRTALVVIWSLTHLKELARLVRFLHTSSHWQPVVMLGVSASATEAAKKEWSEAGITWFVCNKPNPLKTTRVENAASPGTSIVPLDSSPQAREHLIRQVALARQFRIKRTAKILAVMLAIPFLMLVCASLLSVIVICRFLTPYPIRRSMRGRWSEMVGHFRKIRGLLTRYRSGFVAAWIRLHSKWNNLRELRTRLKKYCRVAHAVIGRFRPDAVILAEDNASYPSGIFIKCARQRGIPSAIIPFTLASTKEFIESFRDEPAHSTQRWLNWLVAKVFPKWHYQDRDRGFLRLPAPQVLGLEYYRVAPKRPWIPNDGHWHVFCAESPRMLKRYREEFKLSAHRLVLTGAMSDNTLHAGKKRRHELKQSICCELNLPADQPLVLLAMPPDQFGSPRPDLEFVNYQEMARFLMESLERLTGHNVVVSLHPRTPAEGKSFIESLGARVSTRDTLELVPACDVYIASVSATIRWAISCGIPVINYDLFHYRYDDYDSAAGVMTIQSKREFQEVIERMKCDRDWIKQWTARQRTSAADWGMVDGQSGNRIVELLDRLASGQPPVANAGFSRASV